MSLNTGQQARNRMTSMLVVLSILIAACGSAAAQEVPDAQEFSDAEGATWGGQIEVCARATGDVPGCQWLAGLLIHRGCEIGTYQMFAAALSVGGSFDKVYGGAAEEGSCPETSNGVPAS
ncbi:MAG: hypothetical protein ACC658_08395 [Acidimicrobiia bacterium]